MIGSTRRRFLQNSAVVCLSGLCCLVVLEGFLRIAGLGYGSAPLESDPVLHHVNPANYSFVVYDPNGEFGGHTVQYDAKRRRIGEPTPAREATIFFLGDSFVAGTQVAFGETFVSQLTKRSTMPIVPLNFGVSSYSPVLSRLQLLQALGETRPQAVVHLLYANDSRDDEYYASVAVRDKSGAIVAVPGKAGDALMGVMRMLYVARFFRMAWLTAGEMLKPSQTRDIKEVGGVAFDDDELGAQSRRELMAISSLLSRARVNYILLCVPSKVQFNGGVDHELQFCRQLKAFATANSIKYLDLQEEFSAYAKSKPFFIRDIHFNAYGHALVAEALWRRLPEMGVALVR